MSRRRKIYWLGRYVGPIVKLRGKTALVRNWNRGNVKVQFDNFGTRHRGVLLSFGWHHFPRKHFKRLR